jgi:cation:H+ antiporter
VYMVREARTHVVSTEAEELGLSVDAHSLRAGTRMTLTLAAVGGGIAVLVVGGRLLVDGAVVLARLAGVTERIIGLTVVAAGTSMPELAASVVAAYRKHSDVAIANIIGSNIMNLLGILGITALVHPIPVSADIVATDMWWMLGVSFLLFPLLWFRANLSRLEGVVLLAAYLAYLVVILR